MIGQTISHYKILEKLGEGGMGVVYKAHDTKLDRDVALKFLPPTLLVNEDDRRRFVREAQASAALSHPNIATVFEIDESEAKAFIALEYIEGQSLAEKIKSGPLKLDDALSIAVQTSEGLQAAHEKGIVHRDIKCQNIMVSTKGQVKILDFGLAKLRGASTVTKAGTTVGTMGCMSPEQLRGEPVDHRTDIWAIGVVLYEMIAGRRPFQGDYEDAVAYQVINQQPDPLTAIRTGVPMELERIVKKAMQKNSELRYQHIVEMLTDLRALSKGTDAAATPSTEGKPLSRTLHRMVLPIAAALVVLLIIAGGIFFLKSGNDRITSIAVLPLDNFSRDPDQDYFADGMTETLIANLSKISALKVISRTSVMQYKGTHKLIPEIGRELNVDAILEGSVEKVKDRVRITTQLIRAATDKHLWANSYEREVSDVLSLQDEVAQAVASQIQVAITPQEQTRLTTAKTVNPLAHDSYLKGRFYLSSGDEASLQKAKEFFGRAISIDSTFAPAYAGLSDYYVALTDFYRSALEMMPKAKASATKALQLDETLVEAHVSLGVVQTSFEWDWNGAEREFTRALALNTNYAEGHHNYALFLLSRGRYEQALREIELAVSLDPLSEAIQGDVGWVHFASRDIMGTIDVLNRYLQADSTNWDALWILGFALQESHRYAEAIAALQRSEQLSNSPMVLATLGSAYASSGQINDARKILGELLEIQKHKSVCAYETAILFLQLGDKEEAIRWMEKGYNERSVCMQWIKVDPRVDGLRDDPRFQALQKKIG
jgi:serine/threonine protein kinase/tetratricopeptide (TPR) repeat protein